MDYEIKNLNNGNCEIVKYKCIAKDIIIPNKINGLNVISVDKNAFRYNKLTSIVYLNHYKLLVLVLLGIII